MLSGVSCAQSTAYVVAARFAATQRAGVCSPVRLASASTTSTTGAVTPSMYDEARPSARSSNRASGPRSSGMLSALRCSWAVAVAVRSTVPVARLRSRSARRAGTNARTRWPRQRMDTSVPPVASGTALHIDWGCGTVVAFRSATWRGVTGGPSRAVEGRSGRRHRMLHQAGDQGGPVGIHEPPYRLKRGCGQGDGDLPGGGHTASTTAYCYSSCPQIGLRLLRIRSVCASPKGLLG